jgi:phosphate transport system substrate-binding protein
MTALVAMSAAGLYALAGGAPAGATTYATVNGQGSTYAAPAFQQWTQQEQLQGLNVNYTATGSPAGLQAYEEGTADFAGTEAEYSELYADTPGTPNAHVSRGFAYTPDVAGAIAIMYHVALNATGSDPVNYLQLSPLTVARIFMGIIKNWDSPTITADNKGLVLPNEPIVIDYRSNQSGTTALFYDFVANTDPSQFLPWAQANRFPTTSRIWEVDDGQGTFPPRNAEGFPSSTQQASSVASPSGIWSIGYDEFAFAKVYNDNVAWIENASGTWVQPYALNIAAALQSAVLAPDTSQTLKGVYASKNPLAYPISAYSYILYQCAPTSARPTCKTPYVNPGIQATMAKFMRYIACTGQIKMATIGYSPLPTQLSQFMANAIGYMTGGTPATLNATNCANPQFKGGSLGVGAIPPKDPVATVTSEAPGGGGSSSGAAATSSAGITAVKTAGKAAASGSSAATGSSAAAGSSSGGGAAATGSAGATTTTAPVAGLASTSTSAAAATGGGSTSWLSPSPVAYVGPSPGSGPPWPLLAVFIVLLVPVALFTWGGRRRRRAAHPAAAAADAGPPAGAGPAAGPTG